LFSLSLFLSTRALSLPLLFKELFLCVWFLRVIKK